MSALELCDPDAAVVPVGASVAEAICKMLDFHMGRVAVIDREKRIAGIFTERDGLRKFSLSGRESVRSAVRGLMTTPVELAPSRTGPAEALVIMIERHFRHLPATDNHGKAAGHALQSQPAGVTDRRFESRRTGLARTILQQRRAGRRLANCSRRGYRRWGKVKNPPAAAGGSVSPLHHA